MTDAGISLRRVVRVVALAAVTAGVFGGIGCARDARPPMPVQAQGATAGLRVYVKTFANADVTTLVKSYSAAMRWAGFVMVAQEKDAELVAELRLRVEDESGNTNEERLAQVELVVKGNSVNLGATSVEYDYNSLIPAAELSRLTLAATMSEALDSYALEIQAQELASANRAVEL